MRVGVIGAGGIGGLYGGLLARAGHEVRFLARGAHLDAIQQRGLEVRSADFGTFRVHAPASDDPADLGQSDLLLFAVKTYDLEPAARSAAPMLAPEGSVLTFQNGIDAPDQLAAIVGAEHVLIGTTALETTIVEPGVIGHLTPGHTINVASFEGPPTPRVENIVATLKDAGMNASVAPDGRRALWEKAWLLIPMATLTSVCQAAIGPIRELPETRAFAETLLHEVADVALAFGYDLAHLDERALAVLDRIPATMKASMARDFERGRRTELDALTGALVRLADARGVAIPATRTAYAVLKLREQQAAGSPVPVGTSAGSE
jgi:2-dehydropantoate 2-reductase